jgi:hypothetical protein
MAYTQTAAVISHNTFSASPLDSATCATANTPSNVSPAQPARPNKTFIVFNFFLFLNDFLICKKPAPIFILGGMVQLHCGGASEIKKALPAHMHHVGNIP